jgi:hypothetical protein
MEKLVIIVQELRKRCLEYYKSSLYSPYFANIEIGLCLLELKLWQKDLIIDQYHLRWFKGGRLLDELVSKTEFEDMSNLYNEMIREAISLNILPPNIYA